MLPQFHIFLSTSKHSLDLIDFLATPLYKPFACPFFHVQNKCSTNKCCLCSLCFLRTRVNVPRHKAAQVWRRSTFLFYFVYQKQSKTKQNKTMLPGTRQHKRGRGGGVHTKISRPTASLKEGQYFTSHCLPPPILPCHTACFSQFVWRWGSVLAQSGPLRSPMKICCIFSILLEVVDTAGLFSGCFFKASNCKSSALWITECRVNRGYYQNSSFVGGEQLICQS